MKIHDVILYPYHLLPSRYSTPSFLLEKTACQVFFGWENGRFPLCLSHGFLNSLNETPTGSNPQHWISMARREKMARQIFPFWRKKRRCVIMWLSRHRDNDELHHIYRPFTWLAHRLPASFHDDATRNENVTIITIRQTTSIPNLNKKQPPQEGSEYSASHCCLLFQLVCVIYHTSKGVQLVISLSFSCTWAYKYYW